MALVRARTRLITGHAALAELREPWQTLCDRCPSATPFQRPEWLIAWARHVRGPRPWIVTVHDDHDELIGLAPLGLDPRRRVLTLLGAGASDYGDVLVLPGREPAVLDAMLSAIGHRRARWDACELDEVRPSTSPLTRFALPRGWSVQTSTQSTCPSLSLPSSVAELGGRVPARHYRRFQQDRRRAERAGALRLERATPASCERLLDGLFSLHDARWRARGKPGCLADPHVQAFHRDAAAAFARRDALALYGLHLDDRMIACLYGLEDRQTIYYYLGGFDPAAAQRSPGVLMLGLVLEDAIRRGRSRFDFLRGAETYKYWWGAEDRHTVRLRMTLDRDHARAPTIDDSASAASNRR